MEIIKSKDINKLQILDLYTFLNKLPNHGFKDFSKDKKNFEIEIVNLIKDKRYRFFLEYKKNQIINYFLIKNEDSLNRSIIMTYDYKKTIIHLNEIKKFTKLNSLEIGIRDSEKNQIKEFSFFEKTHTYEFMKLESKKFSKILITDKKDFYIEVINHKTHYKNLMEIQNDCFADHHGFESNSLSDFKSEIKNLEKNQIKSFFQVSKNLEDEWIGYSWTHHNLINNDGRLSMCGIKKQFRNKGLARKLIISAINNLLAKKCTKIYLEVDSNNIPAKKIYKEIGFEVYSKLIWYKIIL